eukprot:gnl/TRDRNA2_/TRDRNA2_161306_c0_seq1.p1 gnl/TRDRNA2_/TRDRNA2_161306_c0~~gnl/TRDRNA2_/TRDRNA2_161306_c0_seq1.p1  ORF type:complete len:709 (-),score=94.98 gnl/TRDRNA2_/TRDRNA2_161306_c0_seq1:118-2244(-)
MASKAKSGIAIPSLRLSVIDEDHLNTQVDVEEEASPRAAQLKAEFADFWGDEEAEEAEDAASPRRSTGVSKYSMSTPRLPVQIISVATPRSSALPAPEPAKSFVPPWPSSCQMQFRCAPTTLELRNLPEDFSTQLLVEQLDAWGFAGRYNFIHVPTDPHTGRCFGFGLVNAETHADGCPMASSLHDFKNWKVSHGPGSYVGCSVSWSLTCQGFDDLCARYQQDPTASWVHGGADGSYIGPWLLWEGNWTAMPLSDYGLYDEMAIASQGAAEGDWTTMPLVNDGAYSGKATEESNWMSMPQVDYGMYNGKHAIEGQGVAEGNWTTMPQVDHKTCDKTKAKPVGAKPERLSGLQPAEPEVLAAIASLHNDELKPYGRILRKRVGENIAANGPDNVDIDMESLKKTCLASVWVAVNSEAGGEWSAVLVDRLPAFVDVYDPLDMYPPELWIGLAAYLESLSDDDMVLPGGRYACAQALAARKLPFLAGQSLGKVCHIVQLAISHHKLLGYRNGSIVPYDRSQSKMKEASAVSGTAVASGSTQIPVATWDMARDCLREILTISGPGGLPLSNVKRLFRSKYQLELSETALGHAKLSGLLQDPRFSSDLCTVRLQDQGYLVLPRIQPASRTICLADELGPPSPASMTPEKKNVCREPRRPVFCPDEPLSFEDLQAPWSPPSAWPALSPGTAFFEGDYEEHARAVFSPDMTLVHC